MKKIIVVMLLGWSLTSYAGEVETVGVKGMVCSFCAQGITKKFKALPEIEDVQVSLEQKKVKLTYKDGQKLSHDRIGEILKDAGYEVNFKQE